MREPKSFDQLTLSDEGAARFHAQLGDERLLSRGQAAQFLGVSARTIDAWMANIRERRRRPRNVV